MSHLFRRVSRLVLSHLHAAIEKFKYPDSKEEVVQAITEINTAIDSVKTELGRITALGHKIKIKRQTAQRNHLESGDQLNAALKAGKKDEAQTILRRQIQIESELTALDDQLTHYEENSRNLETCLNALTAKKEILTTAHAQMETGRKEVIVDSEQKQPFFSTEIDRKLKEEIFKAESAFDRITAAHAEYEVNTQRDPRAPERLRQLEEMALKNEIEKRLAKGHGKK